MVRVEHAMEEVIYKLLKCPLKANKKKKSITFVSQAELGAIPESFIPIDANSQLPSLMAFIPSAMGTG